MAATIDDLLYVASALRVDVRSGLDDIVRRLAQPSGSGQPAPSGGGGAGGTGAVDKFILSTAKAGVALTAFTVLFDKMIVGLGAGLAKFVSLANPAVVMRFNIALENAMSAMGRVLIPVMERFTTVLQMLGNAVESLDPAAKQLIASLTAGGGLAAVFIGIATGVKILMASLGSWVSIIALVAGALAGVFVTMDSGKQLMTSFAGVLKMVGSAFEKVANVILPILNQAAGPIMATLGKIFDTLAKSAVQVATAMMPLLQISLKFFGALFDVFGELVSVVATLATTALVPVLTLFSAVAKIAVDALVPAIKLVAQVMGEVAKFLEANMLRLFKLLGIEPGTVGDDYDPGKKRAQSVRQSSITDLRGAANKAYTMAYGGAAADVPKATLDEAKKHTDKLSSIDTKLGSIEKAMTGNTSVQPARDTGATVGGIAGSIAYPFGGGKEVGKAVGSVVGAAIDPLNIIGRMRNVFGGS